NAMSADRSTLRAPLWRSATALQLLLRTKAISGKLCLVAKRHSDAEPIKTAWLEYWVLCRHEDAGSGKKNLDAF
ncbi:MAG: hypothetical protein KZQ58_06370, partial [gamma proteobacterium symbiont of Bathyaustriella thionipta]|nr:hypothetical protein [gamma proteobacterium symbiont of Bathyaustriella thionipta]